VQVEKAPRPVIHKQVKSPEDGGKTAPKGQPDPDTTVQLPQPDGKVSTPGLTTDAEGWILLAPSIQR
jgi:hypothetical protein